MKTTNIAKLMLVSVTLSLGIADTIAQEENRPRPNREGRPGGPGGPEDRQRRGPGPGGPGFRAPLMEALDADKDGILSKEEIANASKALAKLDKNKDGQITPDEYRPGRPPAGREREIDREERRERPPRP